MASKPQVMIIEDDTDMIELLSIILRRGGYEPIAALGGQEGLRLLKTEKVDLILLDLMMDDMSGWQVLETIKTDAVLCSIPVLIISVSHYLEDPIQTEAHAGQFQGYLLKPFVVHSLLDKVEEAIG